MQRNTVDRGRVTRTPRADLSTTVLPATGFVRLPTVLAVYPVSRSAWWAGISAGRYPRGVKLGPRTTAWRVEQIRELLESGGVELSSTGALSRSEHALSKLATAEKPQ